METIFILFVKDIITNCVDPLDGYKNFSDAKKAMDKENKKAESKKFVFWITPIRVKTNY